MALSESLIVRAIRELDGTECVCGKKKDSGRPLCQYCYLALPTEMRAQLNKTIREGFPEVYDGAKDWLRINTTRIKP
jgi:hypothetical protein